MDLNTEDETVVCAWSGLLYRKYDAKKMMQKRMCLERKKVLLLLDVLIQRFQREKDTASA